MYKRQGLVQVEFQFHHTGAAAAQSPGRLLPLIIPGRTAADPLIKDRTCKMCIRDSHSTVEQESVLEIFAKEKHLRLSRFFYQTEFLSCGFARRKKGSDLVNRRDRSRMREIWSYRWSARVTAALIDCLLYTSGRSVGQ